MSILNFQSQVKALLKEAGESITAGKLVNLFNNKVYNVGMKTINGTEVGFDNKTSAYISAVKLSSTSVLVVYKGTSGYGTAIVLTITGTVITYGTPVAFTAVATDYLSATMLTSTSVLVAYRNVGNAKGTAIVLSISGTVVTYGTAVEFNAIYTAYITARALTSTSVLVTYKNASTTKGTAIVLSISGTVVTYGTAVDFVSASIDSLSMELLSSTSALVTYVVDTTVTCTAIVLSISGTVVTYGTTASIYTSVSAYRQSVIALSSTKGIMVCRQASNFYAYATIINISGTTPSAGVTQALNAVALDGSYPIVATQLSVTSFLVNYVIASSGYVSSVLCSSPSTSIVVGTPTDVNAQATTALAPAVSLNGVDTVVTYVQSGQKGTVVTVMGTSVASGYTPIASMNDGDGTAKVAYIPF